MRKIISITAIAGLAAALVTVGIASAQTIPTDDFRNAPRTGWMGMGQIVSKLEEQGYKVHEVEIDDGVYEVKAVDAGGRRVESDLDPTTGEPIRGWRQDD